MVWYCMEWNGLLVVQRYIGRWSLNSLPPIIFQIPLTVNHELQLEPKHKRERELQLANGVGR